MDWSIRVRLSVMMFLQYFVLGAWVVPLGTYLLSPTEVGGLQFTPGENSLIYSTLALGGLVSPFFTGYLADRLFAAQRLLAGLHFAAAVLIGCAGRVCAAGRPADETFGPLFGAMFAYALAYTTSNTVSTVVAIRNLADPAHSFGSVRLFGTVGWAAAGWAVAFLLEPCSPQPLYLAAAGSLLQGAFCLWLPHTPPAGAGKSLAETVGLPALGLFREPSFRVFVACTLILTAVQAFYNNFANKFLTDLGVRRPSALQTVAQVAEIAFMVLTPLVLPRLGFRRMMMLGVAGWAVRYVLFATENIPLILALGLPLHGFSYTFYFMVATLYVDRLAPPHLRASAQSIVTFLTLGAGALAGNWISGQVVARLTPEGTTDWPSVWLPPAAVAAATLLLFAGLFRPPSLRADDPATAAPTPVANTSDPV